MLRGRVTAMLTLLLVSLVVAAWLGVSALRQANRIDAAKRTAYDTVQQIEHDYFARAEEVVAGLAAHPAIMAHAVSGSPASETVDAVLLQARLTVGAAIVIVLDRNGNVISCSSASVNLVGQNYGFRPYFTEAMRGRKMTYGAIGVTTNQRGFYFSAPVGVPTRPGGVAVVKIDVEGIDGVLRQLTQPAMLLSEDQVVFATNRPAWLFRAARPMRSTERLRLNESRQFADLAIEPVGFDVTAENIDLDGANNSRVTVPFVHAAGFSLVLLDPVRSFPLTSPQLHFVLGTTIAGLLLSGLVVALVLVNARRARAERRQRSTELHLAQTLDSLTDAVITTDRDGRVTRMNPAAVQMTETDPAEAVGRPLYQVLRRDSSDDSLLRLPPSDSARMPLSESRIVQSNGQELRIVGRTIPMGGGPGDPTGAVFVARDVTEENRLREQLLQAQKMEAIGRLAGSIAHDFNNLLTMILGNAELLVHKLERQPLGDYAREVVRAASRAGELTRQLLSFSRKASLRTTAIDFNTVLDEALSFFRRGLEPNIRLVEDRRASATVVSGDATQLQSALLNLFINARDAMPEGGQLHVATRNAPKQIELYAEGDATPGLEVVIQDEGVGIPDSLRGRIFEPFFTTKSEGRGTGLGLAAVYGCMQSHHGHIEVDSREGSGTRFRLWMPTIDKAPVTEMESTLRISSGGGHILVVDADTALRSLSERALRALGYEVTVCVSIEAALRIVTKNQRSITAIVLDSRSNGWSVEHLAAKIRVVDADLPILFTSALGEDARNLRNDERHVAFLDKPFRVQELGRTLETLLGRGSSAKWIRGKELPATSNDIRDRTTLKD